MDILEIKILTNYKSVKIGTEPKEKLFSAVELTVSQYLFWKKKIKAYPTNNGYLDRDGTLDYIIYVDELGKILDDEICEQICYFQFIDTLKK